MPEIVRRLEDEASSGDLGSACCGLSSCLPILFVLSDDLHARVLGRLKQLIVDVSPEVACDVFLVKANILSPEISELLFDRAALGPML